MNLFLIKLGKAIKIVRSDGMIPGGKRACLGFIALFRRVRPGDILIITGGMGDSARYRAKHYAEELEMQGFQVSTTVQDNPFLSRYHPKFNVFIFHRVIYTSAVKNLVKSIKKAKKTIVFDTDDLVFDKKFLQYMDYYRQMNAFEKKFYENGVGGEILKDPYVKVCTTTTSYLAQKLREKGKKVFIIHNKLSKNDTAWADAILARKTKRETDQIRIGYFSGSRSHNKDFATITDALHIVMSRHANVHLWIAGPLDINPLFFQQFKKRITQIPFAPRKKYFELLSNIDINLAPLENGNPFCEAKSELKFFEPGILGIPTIAVKNQTFSEAIDDGENGFLAENTAQWSEKMSNLIADGALRKKMGIQARTAVLKKYTTLSASCKTYYDYLKG
jgi:glycosyltransferase involved in cell wall biosynthesis